MDQSDSHTPAEPILGYIFISGVKYPFTKITYHIAQPAMEVYTIRRDGSDQSVTYVAGSQELGTTGPIQCHIEWTNT